MKRTFLLGLLLLTACQASPAATTRPPASPTRHAPTPRPATGTPTPVPPPTLTATPPPRFFTEEFETVPAYWSTLYASGGSGGTDVLNRGGKLRFELYDQNTWAYTIFGVYEYEAVHIEARVENLASDVNYVGLLCNYNEQAGWFEFNLSFDGSYTLLFGQWLAEGIARYTPILDEPSLYILTEGGGNEMGLDCYEDTVQLYFNGKLFRKLDVSRFDHPRGKVGLAVASFDDLPVIVAFDWVKVEEP
jgi:hypothetical protein